MSETMTDAQIEQWIDACNREPAKEALRHYVALRAEAAIARVKATLIEREDDAILVVPHWQWGKYAIARRPKAMSNEEWRPIANRIIAALAHEPALASPSDGEAGSTREAIQLAIDYLKETKHGNPARSAGHNARLVLEAALALSAPGMVQGNALEKRGIQLNEAHAAFHRADARAEALETALRACRTFVISCRAEAKGRNQNRFALADELLGKIDDALPLAASPSQTKGAEQ